MEPSLIGAVGVGTLSVSGGELRTGNDTKERGLVDQAVARAQFAP